RHTRFSRDWSSDVCSSDLFLDAVHMLREIAPQSPALKKKIVATIAMASPPDTKNDRPPIRGESPPDSPPDSGRDRKGQRRDRDKVGRASGRERGEMSREDG